MARPAGSTLPQDDPADDLAAAETTSTLLSVPSKVTEEVTLGDIELGNGSAIDGTDTNADADPDADADEQPDEKPPPPAMVPLKELFRFASTSDLALTYGGL